MAAMSITKNAILDLSKTLPQVPSLFIRDKVSRVCFSSEGFHASEDFKRRRDFNRCVKDEKTPEMEMAEKMEENMSDGMDKTKQAAKDMRDKAKESAESMKDKTSDMAGRQQIRQKKGKTRQPMWHTT
ncbi:uncharacterized protein LOC132624564 [Lycium barbarum]|uniref:uncharacterized protein LOC132624564 n=1 Tax=Lycium barbarum TaxID=112863 RepID=UPI00293F22A3|nr:uncharacterized protein LOC132624564 [Lycium barbarum]